MEQARQLEPISPEEAVEWYLDSRAGSVAEGTLGTHNDRLQPFVKWCKEQGITNMGDLSGRHFDSYKRWRRDEYGINNVTLNSNLQTLRVFIKYLQRIEAVPRGMYRYIEPNEMAPLEDVDHSFVEPEVAMAVRDLHRKMHWASRNHVIVEMLWHTGMRSGALRGIDLGDYDSKSREVQLHHRPETGTPLKKGKRSERPVSLSSEVCEILDAYIQYNRQDVEDEYGREPLVTTKYGRIGKSTFRFAVYGMTRPCFYDGDCPYGKNQETCEAAKSVRKANFCEGSESPHGIRKSAITYARRNDIPIEAISTRMDVSPEIIERHYDKRAKREKMEATRHFWEGFGE